MMRFLMVTSFYPPHHFGGDATYVRQLSDALRRRGHEVDIVYCYDAYRISGGRTDRLSAGPPETGRVHRLESRFGPLSPLVTHLTGRPALKHAKLKKIFDQPYDVVHFHNLSLIGGPGILPMSKARLTLFTAHEHWTVCPTHIFWKNRSKACDKRQCFACQIRSGRPPQLWRYTRLLSSSFEAVDHIFAPSQFTRHALESGGIERPISVLRLFAPREFETLAPGDGPPSRSSFLYVGRVTQSKGVAQLVSLFAQRPQYDLKIIGDGDLLAALREKTRMMKNVSLLGRQPRSALPQHYRQVTAVVLPSLAPESFGLTTIEGFAQGTPAIVRDAGGASETIRETGAGIIFTADDEALVAFDRLASNRPYRDRLGEIARQSFLRLYTEQSHIEAYMDQVDGLMAKTAAADLA